MTSCWYVLRSKPCKEDALREQLRARGMDLYHPCIKIRPVNPRSRSVRPYFPGYIFIHADLDQVGFSALQWLPFSLGLVSFGGTPASVPQELIHAVQKCVDRINAAGGEQANRFTPGEVVVIQGGAFDGYQAIFDTQLPGDERARVLLKFLQVRQTPLELPLANIRLANLRPARHH